MDWRRAVSLLNSKLSIAEIYEPPSVSLAPGRRVDRSRDDRKTGVVHNKRKMSALAIGTRQILARRYGEIYEPGCRYTHAWNWNERPHQLRPKIVKRASKWGTLGIECWISRSSLRLRGKCVRPKLLGIKFGNFLVLCKVSIGSIVREIF